ncbi:hypothetical protein GPL21_11425 [Bradyrhizobium pachyrhizi]|uniref:Intracellular septation protein n=1 Tax=Bradyrhizobium pachyrhizi TaxID=280333 RepID=A0A844SIS7_9BRAD|nr:hypothetical protein [Bradyrhizobium pachyrhizi]
MRLTMTIFLILAPYGAFAMLMLVTSATVSLLCAALICLAVIAFDVARGRSIKILGVGSVVIFAAIGSYLTFVDATPSNTAVKIAVDAGILLVSLGSIMIGHPFTRQYALEQVDAETAKLPGFLHANYLITGAWIVAMLLMLIGNIAVLYVPALPLWTGLLIAFAARNAAVGFTHWYPHYRAAKDATPPAGALPLR